MTSCLWHQLNILSLSLCLSPTLSLNNSDEENKGTRAKKEIYVGNKTISYSPEK